MTLFAFFEFQADRFRRTLSAPYVPTVAAPKRRQVKGNHGTLHCYAVLHCRCLPCRGANAEYKRERRAIQRAKLAQYRAVRRVEHRAVEYARRQEMREGLARYRASQEAQHGA